MKETEEEKQERLRLKRIRKNTWRRGYYQTNKEKICARTREFKARNKEKIAVTAKVYAKSYVEKLTDYYLFHSYFRLNKSTYETIDPDTKSAVRKYLQLIRKIKSIENETSKQQESIRTPMQHA